MSLPFSVAFEPASATAHGDTLALVRYGTGASAGDPREIRVPLAIAGAAMCEHWRSPLPVQQGREDGFSFAENGEVLYAQLQVSEPDLHNMQRAAQQAYSRIAHFLHRHGYPHLLRTWNYFHDIHLGTGRQERYQQFVAGRYEALAGVPEFERQLPAATAIGTRSEGMLIYFLAAKKAGSQIENPRQTSAFRYPEQYGPRSPSFSRATLVGSGQASCLLVSGTASIVGHASQHLGDAPEQLLEVTRNLEALLRRASDVSGSQLWHPVALKLYLRDPALLPALEPALRQQLGERTTLLCLEGDICRSDLLVEIEGIYMLA